MEAGLLDSSDKEKQRAQLKQVCVDLPETGTALLEAFISKVAKKISEMKAMYERSGRNENVRLEDEEANEAAAEGPELVKPARLMDYEECAGGALISSPPPC